MFFSIASMANVKAVCTLPWISSILGEIAGDKVEVTTFVKPDEDPHYTEPKPSMLLAARKAELLFYNGLDLEIGYLPRIIESSNNPRIQPGQEGNVDLSQFIIEVVEKPATLDRSMGDIHPLGNPHYYFSPRNVRGVAKGITLVLCKADQGNSTFYKSNLETFLKKLEKKELEWQKLNLKGRKVIAYHKDFSYLAQDYGINFIDYIEPKPGIPPSAKHVAALLQKIKAERPDLILCTNVIGGKEVDYLSKSSGVRGATVPQDVGGTAETKDWFSFVDSILREIGG